MNREKLHEYWKTRSTIGENNIFSYIKGNKKSLYMVSLFERFRIDRNSSILEIGCNVGRNLNALYEAGYPVLTGIDINPSAVAKAADLFPKLRKIVERSIEDFFAKPRAYDVIFSMAVMEHLPSESDPVFKSIAKSARKYIITIEYEGESGNPRIIQRDYKRIFEKFGFAQVHAEDVKRIKGLNKYTARVFKRNSNG